MSRTRETSMKRRQKVVDGSERGVGVEEGQKKKMKSVSRRAKRREPFKKEL